MGVLLPSRRSACLRHVSGSTKPILLLPHHVKGLLMTHHLIQVCLTRERIKTQSYQPLRADIKHHWSKLFYCSFDFMLRVILLILWTATPVSIPTLPPTAFIEVHLAFSIFPSTLTRFTVLAEKTASDITMYYCGDSVLRKKAQCWDVFVERMTQNLLSELTNRDGYLCSSPRVTVGSWLLAD